MKAIIAFLILLAWSLPLRAADVVVDRETETVLVGAMNYLAGKQAENGSWSSTNNNHQTAITAYVLMSFMASGHLPGETEHGKVVSRGAEFLLSCAPSDGYIAAPTGDSNMYGHGIASIALCELYGQHRDPALRQKLQKAITLIVNCQNEAGGWRYQPRVADADVSVTVLQVVALRAAKNSGIEVPQETIDKAVKFVRACANPGGGFDYMPGRREAGFARTAAAIYSLQVCGRYDDPLVATGSKYLFDHLEQDREWFTYGQFYAAPAQYMIGGDVWRKWYTQIRPILLAKVQRSDGMCWWEPLEGNKGVNEVFATAVYATALAIPYAYIPLYQR